MAVFNEDTRVKIPATIQFLRIGYDYQSLKDADIDFQTKIFINRFKPALEKVNGRDFSYDEIKEILMDINNVIKNNDSGKEFYNWLINPLDKVKLIDFEDISKNDFAVVDELPYCVVEGTESGSFRPDVNILINGMPLSFLEVKKPNNDGGIQKEFERMINQRLRNPEYKKFFNMLQFIAFSNNMEYEDADDAEDVKAGSFYTTPNGQNTSFSFFREDDEMYHLNHPYKEISDDRVIGAAGFSKEDKKLHPTAAGMLMFGNEYDIVRYFPEYFLDYRENPDTVIRWTDRIQSSSGEWSGNLFDFYFRVYNKIIKDIKVPFKMQNRFRVDDTPVHRALREALANCIINTDFYGKYGIIIIKDGDKLTLENPGYIRLGKEQMRRGGKSDPRNKSLMKMFNMIDIGEHAGSGVPNIFNVWEDEGWEEPVIEESFAPDRTSLILKFVEKQAIKTSENMEKVRVYLQKCETAKTSDIAQMLGLSVTRTRALLFEMEDVEALGANRTRTYRLRR